MAGKKLADNVSSAILNQDDPQTVKEGAPAYLLLVDGLIEGEPHDVGMLQTGATLYGAYAAVFVEDPERAKRLASKALSYAHRQLCEKKPDLCGIRQQPFEQFMGSLSNFRRADLAALYSYATAWAIWIQTHSEDWAAVAELPKTEAMMDRIVELDDAYQQGQPHLYLGIMRSALPPGMGGRPELARKHFDRAIQLCGGRNLLIKVEYARRYARLMFERELHDRLLTEVIQADPVEPGFTLSNTLAQQQARRLLDSSQDYFLD
jgi:hypothetical protein